MWPLEPIHPLFERHISSHVTSKAQHSKGTRKKFEAILHFDRIPYLIQNQWVSRNFCSYRWWYFRVLYLYGRYHFGVETRLHQEVGQNSFRTYSEKAFAPFVILLVGIVLCLRQAQSQYRDLKGFNAVTIVELCWDALLFEGSWALAALFVSLPDCQFYFFKESLLLLFGPWVDAHPLWLFRKYLSRWFSPAGNRQFFS